MLRQMGIPSETLRTVGEELKLQNGSYGYTVTDYA